jgi:EpsI family protein
MEWTASSKPGPAPRLREPAALGCALMLAALWAFSFPGLARAVSSEAYLSQAPVLLLLAVAYLWWRRADFLTPSEAPPAAALLLAGSAMLHAGGYLLEIELAKGISLLGMTAGAAGLLAGRSAFVTTLAAMGLLLFGLAWPESLIQRVALPLQLASSAYAALLAGLLGFPVERDGVRLGISGHGGADYQVLVAQDCSGLSSLLVLLALAYGATLLTPVRPTWKALLILGAVPMAILGNTLRLTSVLVAGAYHSPGLAKWLHDSEGPVLMLFCSLGLALLRGALLRTGGEEDAPAPPRPPALSVPGRWRAGLAVALLALALTGAAWPQPREDGAAAYPTTLPGVQAELPGWTSTERKLTASEQRLLAPDATLLRGYRRADGARADVTVIAGHRKRAFHDPEYCMRGDGWEALSTSTVALPVPGWNIRAQRTLADRKGEQAVLTFFWTDGRTTTSSLFQFQWSQLLRRLSGKRPWGATVRIVVPAGGSPEAAARLSDELAGALLPKILPGLAAPAE